MTVPVPAATNNKFKRTSGILSKLIEVVFTYPLSSIDSSFKVSFKFLDV